MAAGLTKEQLRNELIAHGVQPPVQSARKEEFIKLYEQHVAPIASTKGDFSSDDEEIESPTNEVHSNSLNGNGIDVTGLSDEELYAQLQFYGIPAGPILESTRSVYQRKLVAVMMNGAAPVATEVHTNGNGNGNGHSEDKYSDSEEEVQEIVPAPVVRQPEPSPVKPEKAPTVVTRSATPVVVAAPLPAEIVEVPSTSTEPLSGMTSIRKRVQTTERPPSSLSALPLVDRQGTPTPRPSIRNLPQTTSGQPFKYESRRLLDSTDGSTVQPLPAKSFGVSPQLIRYALFIFIAMAVAYITYTSIDGNQAQQWIETIKGKLFQSANPTETVAEKVDQAQPNPASEV